MDQMTSGKVFAPSAARRTAQALRTLALGASESEFLGSEEDLMTRFRVSRPTLRQAAAQVAQEQLITIKRGVRGGYFACIPTSMTVARIVALYLQRHGVRLQDMIEAVQPIRAGLVRMAARNRDPAAHEALRQFLENERGFDSAERDYRYFLRAERAYGRLLSEISGNQVLGLFLAILYDFAAVLGRDEDVYVNRPDRVEQYRADRNRMAEAILAGDEDGAALASRRCSATVTGWLMQDMAGREFDRRITDIGDAVIIPLDEQDPR